MKHLFFILFLFVAKISFSQNINDIQFDVLDEKNGLSNQWYKDIALDSSGYLWIGTCDGLNRFDGHSFKVFRHDEKEASSLLHDNGQAIAVTKKGDIWISYAEGGFSTYNKNCQCFTHYTADYTKTKYPLDRRFGIKHIDSDGNLWFSGSGLGLNKFYPGQNKSEHFDLPFIKAQKQLNKVDRNTVHYIYESEDGLLWLCTQNGLYSFDRKSKTFSYKSSFNSKAAENTDFNKLIPEGKAGYWLSSAEGGMHYYDIKSDRFTTYLFETKLYGYYNLIFDFAIKSKDEFWVVSGDKGLGVFNKIKGTFEFQTNFANTDGTEYTFLSQLIVTPRQEMFVCDETSLLKYIPSSRLFNFKHLDIQNSQHGNVYIIRKIIENPELNETYFATDLGNGLNILNTKTKQVTGIPLAVNTAIDKKMRLNNMLQDRNGTIWILSRDYIHEFNVRSKKVSKIENPFTVKEEEANITFRNFTQDTAGKIWVLTNEGNVYPFSISEKKLDKKLNLSDGHSNFKKVDYITFDAFNSLWLIGDNKLAYSANGTSPLTFIADSVINKLLKNELKAMVSDAHGNIWIALSHCGLLKIETGNTKKITYKLFAAPADLPTNRINNMGADPYGNIWMSTIKGVVYFNALQNSYKVFNQTVGMDKYIFGMRFLKNDHNSFYITTPGKYCKVDINLLSKEHSIPKVYIDNITISNKKIPASNQKDFVLELQPQQNFFSFDFGCIDFSSQAYHQFSYILEGWDKEWQNAGTRRFANYTNVSGGKYTFRVKVSNAEGMWSEPVSFNIYIQTPFYKTTWFIFMLVALFALLIYFLYKYRIQQIRKTEKLKTEFNKQIAETRMEALRAQMNPHFIFNCLNSINRYIVKNDIKTSSLYLTRFAKLMRLVLDNSKHKKISLSSEMEALKLYIEMEVFRFEQKFTFEINIDENVETDTIEVPPLIIQPYVENAIWHGLLHKENQGHLRIGLKQTDDFLLIEIEDNGIGRVRAQAYKNENTPTRKSVGMKLTEERLNYNEENELANAPEIIDLYDDEGNAAGTLVKIKIYI